MDEASCAKTRSSNNISINYNAENSMLMISSPIAKINSVRISDVAGNEIFSEHFSTPAEKILKLKLPLLKQGIYLLAAEVNGIISVQKFSAR